MEGPGESRPDPVLKNPVLLLNGVGDWAAASCFDDGKGFARRPSKVYQRAGSGNGGAADASTAVNADVLSGAEAACKPGGKDPESYGVRRNVGVGKGMREELHSGFGCHAAFVLQSEPCGLILFEERDESLNSTLLELGQFIPMLVISARAENEGQREFRLAFDPEDIAQYCRTPSKHSTRPAWAQAFLLVMTLLMIDGREGGGRLLGQLLNMQAEPQSAMRDPSLAQLQRREVKNMIFT